MTMSEQPRRCSFGLTKTFFSRFSKSAFSLHDNVRPSSTLFIWLDENVHLSCFGINTSTMTEEHKKHEEVVFTFSSLCATGKVLPACEKCIGKLSPGYLLRHSHVCHSRMWQNFRFYRIFSYLCLGTSYMSGGSYLTPVRDKKVP